MLKQHNLPFFVKNLESESGTDLTDLFFQTITRFNFQIETEGWIVDNSSQDDPQMAEEVELVREFLAAGARPETVLARLAVRDTAEAHLAANMIRRHAGLPARSLRDLVLFSLNHRAMSSALGRSETVYLKRASVLDEKKGGLSPKGAVLFAEDEEVVAAAKEHRSFKRPSCGKVILNTWMKFCPI